MTSPNQGPESYRYTPDRPKLLRSPPTQGGGSRRQAAGPSVEEEEAYLERLQAEVATLQMKAQDLGEQGEDMRIALHDMQSLNKQLGGEVWALENAIDSAKMKQQEAEEDLSVLDPKHHLMKQEHARVLTTITDLRLEAQSLEPDAMNADDSEEALAMLLQNVVHRSTIDMMEHEQELDLEATRLKPQLAAANKERAAAKQELQKLRARLNTWTTGRVQAPAETEDTSNMGAEQRKLMGWVASASDASEAVAAEQQAHHDAQAHTADGDGGAFNAMMQSKFTRAFESFDAKN